MICVYLFNYTHDVRLCVCPMIASALFQLISPKVKGILSEEEIRRVEEIHQQHFAWEQRRWRLLEVIQGDSLRRLR